MASEDAQMEVERWLCDSGARFGSLPRANEELLRLIEISALPNTVSSGIPCAPLASSQPCTAARLPPSCRRPPPPSAVDPECPTPLEAPEIACPRLSIDWGEGFKKPMLKTFEFDVALGYIPGW
ncbi:hypothetical protein ABZP36_020562 [Zizania latifolia]